jgi:putative nucleotidyltransferase with HDIG domain
LLSDFVNSLKFKILGLLIIIMVATVGLTAWHNVNTQTQILTSLAEQNGRVLGETIRNSIIASMINGQSDDIITIMERIKREPVIRSIRILDENGRILLSAQPEEIGDLIAASELLAYRSGRHSFFERYAGEDYHSSTMPIVNTPNCHACHDHSMQNLGVLNLQLSLTEMSAMQNKGRQITLWSSAGMLLMLALTVSAFILIYVDAPIRRLIGAMKRVEEGDFAGAQTTIRCSDEMAMLASKFNNMVEQLRSLIDDKVSAEKEMAVAQQKLAHHDQIRNMNTTLEERLREIEYLNITLEERIEEIEEANYRVADLAEDLEEKNRTLEQAVSRLSAIYKMGLAINSTMDLSRLFDLLIRKTMETLNAEVGYILLLDKDTWVFKIAGAVGIPEHIDLDMLIPVKPGGVSHWVVEHRQPLLIEDIRAATYLSPTSRLGYKRESVICVPLTIQDKVIGTMTIANRQDAKAFSREDLDLLSPIAAQASVAIRNARLYEEQQSTYLNTVQALVSAIEASDAYTRGHSERVTRYSLAVARQMNLPAESLKRLEQAAVLHDIGKIGIDIALLHKEGTLSLAEVDILQQHPLIGVRILEPISFLKGVREIIEQHHERFDGKGYPYGLRAEELLLEARILAVADTYDAMTSDRPYRQALPHEFAIREIQEHAGAQFDPQVTEVFVAMWQSAAADFAATA